ncbi:MAG: hypothetical protein ACK53Z_16250 [Betaproteobacteria bacterium]|jgi:hypothetical protein
MIRVSDANPIQFWPLGVPTYNEKPEPGVDHACYFKKWNAEDEIALQFYDTNDFNYQLEILDQAGTVLHTRAFTKSFVNGIYVFDTGFRWTDIGVDNAYVRAQIVVSFFDINGGVVDPIEAVSGTITNTVTAFNISGGVNDPVEAVAGTIETPYDITVSLFGYTTGLFWTARFTNTLEIKSYSLDTNSGLSDTDGGILESDGTGNVTGEAQKTSNGGIAQDAGTVVFYKNGSAVPGGSIAFNIGDNVSAISYNYTGLVPTDDLGIEIYEG